MGDEPSPESRVTIVDDEFDGYRIVIANPSLWGARIALGTWLCAWVFGEVAAIRTFTTGRPIMRGGPSSFLGFWLVGWTIGGFCMMATWAWLWFGREVVVVGGDRLLVRREVAGIGLTSKYRLAEVSNLRYDPPVRPDPFRFGYKGHRWQRGKEMGNLMFNHDRGTKDFGIRLSEPDCRIVIQALAGKIKPQGVREG